MAKGNIFMGTVKGRIGDNVFYVKKGEQNIVKYQSEVSNPKTTNQSIQRGKFASAGKFYTRGTQALFKFAFENKKPNESDFNAFMRENISNAISMSKLAIDFVNYPMVNDWLMTRGSLLTPSYTVEQRQVNLRIPVDTSFSATIDTVADLTKLLIANGDYKEGDILTWVGIKAYVGSQPYPAIVPDILLEEQVAWSLKQIKLSRLDLSTLQSHGLTVAAEPTYRLIRLTMAGSNAAYSYTGGCVVLSRKTKNGLKVSTSRLKIANNENYQKSIKALKNYAETEEYLQLVADSWKNEGNINQSTDIVLEGSLVSKASITTSGSNPVQSGEDFSDSEPMTIGFDPRSGYLTATIGMLDEEEAIEAIQSGDVQKYYWNPASKLFLPLNGVQEGEEVGFQVYVNTNDTYSIWVENGNRLFFGIKSWTNAEGQTVKFL